MQALKGQCQRTETMRKKCKYGAQLPKLQKHAAKHINNLYFVFLFVSCFVPYVCLSLCVYSFVGGDAKLPVT